MVPVLLIDALIDGNIKKYFSRLTTMQQNQFHKMVVILGRHLGFAHK